MQSKSAELSGAIRPRRRTDRVGLATGPLEPARGHKFTRGNDFNRLTALSRNSRRIPSLPPAKTCKRHEPYSFQSFRFLRRNGQKPTKPKGIFRHAQRNVSQSGSKVIKIIMSA